MLSVGINTAAKFQECLLVLRDIVMHALRIKDTHKPKTTPPKPEQDNPVEELTNQVRASMASGSSRERENGVNTAQLGNPLWEVESTAHVVRRQAWQAETSESRTLTAASGSSYSVQQRQHPVVESSPQDRDKREKRLPQASLSPSPNSLLSSGFGSLQEEDCTLYESSDNRRRNTTWQLHASPSSVSTGGPYSHTTSRQAAGVDPSPLHTSSHHESIATGTRKTQALPSSPENTGKMTKSYSTKHIITSQTESSKNRHEPILSQTPNERTVKSQSIRYHSSALSPTSPPFEQQSKPLSQPSPSVEQHRAFKPLSPTDEKALQQLKERQVQLQRSREERQKLTSNVQLLDLRVQEEELR